MKFNVMPYAISWALLASVVIVLAVWRKMVASHEDDTLHVLDKESAMVAQQAVTANKLEAIDKWGKWLTVVALLYGIGIAVAYVYFGYVADTTIRME